MREKFDRWRDLLKLRTQLGSIYSNCQIFGFLQFGIEYDVVKSKLDAAPIRVQESMGFIELETSDKALLTRLEKAREGTFELRIFTTDWKKELPPIESFTIEGRNWNEGPQITTVYTENREARLTYIPRFAIYGSWPRNSNLQISISFEDLMKKLAVQDNYQHLVQQLLNSRQYERKLGDTLNTTKKFLDMGKMVKYKVLEYKPMNDLLRFADEQPHIELLLVMIWKITRSTSGMLYRKDHARYQHLINISRELDFVRYWCH